MGKNREKYFRCPKCGSLTTKTEILKYELSDLCSCDLVEYDEITKKEYESRINESD